MSLRALTVALLLALASTTNIAAAPPPQATPPSPPAVPPATAQAPAPAALVLQEQETHGDWRVACASPNNQKVCVFSQQITDKASGQRVFGIEVRAATADRLTTTMIMPLGVAVDKPVTIRIDQGPPMMVPFKTCIQIGCVVTTTWEAPMVAALRKGTALFVNVITADGKDAAFRVSLNGFGEALVRSIVLAKP